MCNIIWPRGKIGQGQPRMIIWTNYDRLKSHMQHTQFSRQSTNWFQRRRFFKRGFYLLHGEAWEPSSSCDHYELKKITIYFHVPKSFHLKIWFQMAQWFLRKTSFNFGIWVTLGHGLGMTLIFDTHLTHSFCWLHVQTFEFTDCKSFWKFHIFFHLPIEMLSDEIWLWPKIGHG